MCVHKGGSRWNSVVIVDCKETPTLFTVYLQKNQHLIIFLQPTPPPPPPPIHRHSWHDVSFETPIEVDKKTLTLVEEITQDRLSVFSC